MSTSAIPDVTGTHHLQTNKGQKAETFITVHEDSNQNCCALASSCANYYVSLKYKHERLILTVVSNRLHNQKITFSA